MLVWGLGMSIYFQASVSAIKKKSHWQLYNCDNGIQHWYPSKGQCKIFIGLTFMGLCIANIFTEYNQQAATFQNLFISVRRSMCFRRFFHPSSGAQNCTYSIRYWSDQYLTLYVQFWAPDDGWKNRLKHVERLTEINKLWNVPACWLYSVNIFNGVHFMLQVILREWPAGEVI